MTLVGVGTLLRLTHRGDTPAAPAIPQPDHGEGCCGRHAVCEKVLPTDPADDYYDDEELDAYRGRTADSYAEDDVERFREVLYTLRPDEVLAWAQAIERRRIALPDELRDELLIMLDHAV